MLIEMLPKLFQANPLMVKLAELTQGKKVLFSSIVYQNQAKAYIIKKTEDTPYFEQDWQCYSFYRSYAKTSITTGKLQSIKVLFCEQKKIYSSLISHVGIRELKRCMPISEPVRNKMSMWWHGQCTERKYWHILILISTMSLRKILQNKRHKIEIKMKMIYPKFLKEFWGQKEIQLLLKAGQLSWKTISILSKMDSAITLSMGPILHISKAIYLNNVSGMSSNSMKICSKKYGEVKISTWIGKENQLGPFTSSFLRESLNDFYLSVLISFEFQKINRKRALILYQEVLN